MAKYWDQKIDINTDWDGDDSTSNLPVLGSRVQEFIKDTLRKKIERSELDERALHGYDSAPKTLKEVDESKIDKSSIVGETGQGETSVMHQKAVTDELSTKADHGYESNPKTLKEVDDSVSQLAGEVSQKASHGYLESEIPKTLKQVDDEKADHGYASIEVAKTLKQVEDNTSVKMTNLFTNGDFSNGSTGWDESVSSHTYVIASGILTATRLSDGDNIVLVRVQTGETPPNSVVYTRYRVRVLQAGATSISAVYGSAVNNIISSPNANEWYDVIDRFTTGSSLHIRSGVRVIYPTGQALTGYAMEVDYGMQINLTQVFGAGNEPTKEEMDLLISTLGIDCFEGEITIPAQKIMQWQLKLANIAEQNADDAREAIQDDLALKANHGYGEGEEPKTLKEVDEEKADLISLINKSIQIDFVRGSISNIEGSDLSAGNRIRTDFLPIDFWRRVEVPATHKISVRVYDENKSFIEASNWDIRHDNFKHKEGYVRFVIAYQDDSSILPEQGSVAKLVPQIEGYVSNEFNNRIPLELDPINNELSPPLSFGIEQGGFKSSDGSPLSAYNRVRTSFILVDLIKSCHLPTGYKIAIWYFSALGEYVTYIDWSSPKGEFDIPEVEGAEYIRFTIAYEDDRNITPEDIQGVLKISTSLKSEITADVVGKTLYDLPVSLAQGSLIKDTGGELNSTTRVRTDFINLRDLYLLSLPSGFKISYRFFDKNYNFISSSGWVWAYGPIIMPDVEGSVYVRFVIAYEDDALISPSDLTGLIIKTDIARLINNENTLNAGILPTPTMVLKCAKEFNYDDGTPPKTAMYLFYDNGSPIKFYVAKNSPDAEKQFLFDWDFSKTYNGNAKPEEYSIAIMDNGDILCVWRSELILTGSDDSVRKNAIIYPHDDYSSPKVIDFGEAIRPSGWFGNVGAQFIYPLGVFMFCEYTRPSVEYARVWRVVYPYDDPNNWSIVKEIQLSGHVESGFKHFHHISYDHFSGNIYATTGDDNSAAAIYVSTDNGFTFSLLHGPNEADCRLLNFVYTEDFIYWSSDTYYDYNHHLFRIERDENGIMDFNTLTRLVDGMPMNPNTNSNATYALVFLKKLNALVFLNYADLRGSEINIDVWDISAGILKTAGVIKSVDGTELRIGFRCEYVSIYPHDNKILTGFSSGAKYHNNNKGLGNTLTSRINNYVISIDKQGEEFYLDINTVY